VKIHTKPASIQLPGFLVRNPPVATNARETQSHGSASPGHPLQIAQVFFIAPGLIKVLGGEMAVSSLLLFCIFNRNGTHQFHWIVFDPDGTQ
jgi:hypothetical protein